ncbi:uncharacterized protein LOC105436567 [Strongylocentrotus purpuratus]|uniref:Uncharacterized protein n=1 Tax=Strongylocentrotus purpuratus TaxID=7668 RepID=A0A7M7NGG9_STRPU|nr:uncharacterized protein LOC105436567 [Strongylocentrotus purpuratus]
MAIMHSCCCFSNVRSGSLACGVFSLITSCFYLAEGSWNLALAVSVHSNNTGPAIDGTYAAYSIDIIVDVFLLIASIVLLVGVSVNNRTMLIPYMVAIMAVMVLQAITWLIQIVFIGAAYIVLIVILVVWLLYTAFNIMCLLCVISQYQELSEGRGRAMQAQWSTPITERSSLVL